MKLRKILAAVAATTVAVSAMSVASFAAVTVSVEDANVDAAGVLTIAGTDEDTEEAIGILAGTDIALTDIYGVSYTVTSDATQFADEEFWIGGGLGFNSVSTDWMSVEWGKASGEKPIVLDETGVLTYLAEAPIFTAEDEWAQAWIQAWGGDVVVTAVSLLDAEGNAIVSVPTATEEETTAPTEEETTAPEVGDSNGEVGDSEEVPGDSSGNNNNGGNDDTNENTGIALVVIPAIIAGAAATVGGVSLKRKSK